MTNPSRLYQAFIEQTGQAFFAYDLEAGKFSYVNSAFRESFVIPEDKTNAEALLDMVHPEDHPYIKECMIELMSQGASKKIEIRLQLPAQEIQWVCLNASLFQDEGEKQLILGHVEDITAQREYNNHLKKFSNKKNSVLNILSHDLMAPMRMIENLSVLLTEQLESSGSKDALHIISLIERSSKHGAELLQQFMNQEFLESSQTELVTRRVNVVEKMQELMDEYRGEKADLLAKRVEFITSSNEIYAEIDDLKFMQVITNLISNALKFTPDGCTIKVSLEEEEEGILVKVADDGIGIPEKYHPTVFDKFTKARRPGLNGERTVGLGLSICKTLIEWHKGKIWFESEENKGTTFFIRIPKR